MGEGIDIGIGDGGGEQQAGFEGVGRGDSTRPLAKTRRCCSGQSRHRPPNPGTNPLRSEAAQHVPEPFLTERRAGRCRGTVGQTSDEMSRLNSEGCGHVRQTDRRRTLETKHHRLPRQRAPSQRSVSRREGVPSGTSPRIAPSEIHSPKAVLNPSVRSVDPASMNDREKIVPTNARQDTPRFGNGKRNFVKKQKWGKFVWIGSTADFGTGRGEPDWRGGN